MGANGSAKSFGSVHTGAIILLGVGQEGAIGIKAQWGDDSPVVLLTGKYRGTLTYPNDKESVLELAGAEVRVVADIDNTRWDHGTVGDILMEESTMAIVAKHDGRLLYVDLSSGRFLDGAPAPPLVVAKDWQVVQKVDGKLVFLGLDRDASEA